MNHGSQCYLFNSHRGGSDTIEIGVIDRVVVTSHFAAAAEDGHQLLTADDLLDRSGEVLRRVIIAAAEGQRQNISHDTG